MIHHPSTAHIHISQQSKRNLYLHSPIRTHIQHIFQFNKPNTRELILQEVASSKRPNSKRIKMMLLRSILSAKRDELAPTRTLLHGRTAIGASRCRFHY
ncbi:hypothetical protein Lal_00047026 [Lupinus albus]|nr:hypothetical protein Lal_00047026 [Lupinus albus]